MTVRQCLYPIRQIIVYKGHEKNPLLGPYFDSIMAPIKMFHELNPYRQQMRRPTWNITSVAGEQLVDALKECNPEETLLAVPAGQSTRLDAVFPIAETSFIKREFFEKGGRGYFTCGSAYWASEKRSYKDLCAEQPENRETIIKMSKFPLFEGIAEGPLCLSPSKKYKVDFFSDAVRVTNAQKTQDECTIYLSGGGSFSLRPTAQKIKVLVKYLHSEMIRCGKRPQECERLENAVIMASIGKGAALLSMFHPYYDPSDIDVEVYGNVFGDGGTDWRAVHARLSPSDTRMRFILNAMLMPLEDREWG